MTVAFTLATTGRVADDLIALNARLLPAMSRRDHVAWVMNLLAHEVAPLLTRWDAEGRALSEVATEDIRLEAHIAPQGYLAFAPVAAPPYLSRSSTAPAASVALARLFAPSVTGLAPAGPLAPRGLWRIVGDGLAFGWVLAGQSGRAEDVLRRYRAPFSNRQLKLAKDTILRRGGCCRYLAVSGEICSNCALNKTEARRSLSRHSN